MTKISELRALEDADLEVRLEESKKELFNLRFQLATGRLDNVTRIQTVRREIAGTHAPDRARLRCERHEGAVMVDSATPASEPRENRRKVKEGRWSLAPWTRPQ